MVKNLEKYKSYEKEKIFDSYIFNTKIISHYILSAVNYGEI